MAMQEYQYIQKILKEVYAPAIVNQMPKKVPAWAIFEKKTADFAGKQLTIPVQLAFSEAVGGAATNIYDLPEAQRNTYDQTYIKIKRIYGRVMVDGFSIEASKGKGGWVDILTNEIKGVTNAFALDMDRQTITFGTGIIGLVNTAISSSQNYIVVKDAAGLTGDTPATKFFRKGMKIYIPNSTTPYTGQITSVDAANNKIYVSPNIGTAAAGDAIYRYGVYDASVDNIGEVVGIGAIVSAGNLGSTFQGIDATTEPLWQAYVKSSAGLISETLIQETLDAIDQRTDGEPVDQIWTTYAIRNKLITMMQALRQLVNTQEFTAGWKAIKYVGGNIELPIIAHPRMFNGYMYFISSPHIKRYELLPLTWDDKGGGVVKPVAGKDAYEAWFKVYTNYGTDCRNAHGVLTGVTTS